MENNKPISEWTLKEVQEMCDNRSNCTECTFYDSGNCEVCRVPVEWPLGKAEALTAISATDTDAARKPRLAEVLGVEVGERFRISENGGTLTFWVTEKGYFKTDPPEQVGSTYMLLDAINHPESIIRLPRLTEAELTICKAVGAKWLTLDCVTSSGLSVYLWDKKPRAHEVKGVGMCYYASDSGAKNVARIDGAVFPGVKPGDCICVEEVDK